MSNLYCLIIEMQTGGRTDRQTPMYKVIPTVQECKFQYCFCCHGAILYRMSVIVVVSRLAHLQPNLRLINWLARPRGQEEW